MGPIFQNLAAIEKLIRAKLKLRNIKQGDDVVTMVTNDGEMDLFLNFACSCRAHNISLRNVLVFAASKEIVPMIEAVGAIGIHQDYFASVAREASVGYLDRVFIDMMWYKAFSVWTLLHMGYN
eukprot:gene3286-4067_t